MKPLTLKEQRDRVRKLEDLDLRLSLIDTINSSIDTFGEDSYIQSTSTPEAIFNHEVREMIEEMKNIKPKNSSFILYSKFSEIVTKRHVSLEKLKEKGKGKSIKSKSYHLDDE